MSKFVVTAKVQIHPERSVRKSLDRSMVQSITPRCNDSQSSIGKKRSRTSKVRSRATGQLQAHRL